MSFVLAVDLGTTKISALALDVDSGLVVASRTMANQAETTAAADKDLGYSEWDALGIADLGCACLRGIAEQLGPRLSQTLGLGITGQQHGVVIVDDDLAPLTPFINWQDRRANQGWGPGFSRTSHTYVEHALELAGPDAAARTGCRLAAGYLGTTLCWMKETGVLPAHGIACFIMDLFGALLTEAKPVTDATCGASSGLFNVARGDWDAELIARLGLPQRLFPEVKPSGARLAGLAPAAAAKTGLPSGLPVFVGIGDNQASFLGSVGNPADAVLVNVGTGGQVAAYTPAFAFDPQLETRPFPRGGYLLVSAGLAGGAAYAVLERFFRLVAKELLDTDTAQPLFQRLNELAAKIPRGAAGLRCEPFFAGTRARPDLRGVWSGVSVENFTPAHMARALLEGMAETFRGGYDLVTRQTGKTRARLVGAGNGLRDNVVLAQLVADAFVMPLSLPRHREEAAYGAALLAAVAAGRFSDLPSAGRLVRFESNSDPGG
jgi:sugar (pentulose or hexulose) kinase